MSRLFKGHRGLTAGLLQGLTEVLLTKVESSRISTEIAQTLDNLSDPSILAQRELEPGILKSADLNKNYENAVLVLYMLYRSLLTSEKKLSDVAQLAQSDAVSARQKVLQLLQDLRVSRYLKLNPTFRSAKIMQFVDGRNKSSDSARVVVDERSNSLRLDKLYQVNLTDLRGQRESEATVTYLTDGVSGYSSRIGDPKYVIDGDEHTVWSETVFTDSPVTTTYDSVSYEGLGVQIDVDCRIALAVNTIEMKPLSNRPARLVDLLYSVDGTTWTTIPDFVEPSRRALWWTFSFSPVPMRFIRAVLIQDNGVTRTFHIPQSVLRNQSVFSHVVESDTRFNLGQRQDSEIETRMSTISDEIGLTLDELGNLGLKNQEVLSGNTDDTDNLRAILETLLKVAGVPNVVLGTLSVDSADDELVEVQKVDYTVGLAHVDLRQRNYHKTGKFVSPKLSIQESPGEIAIEVTQSIPTTTDDVGTAFPLTTVEYECELSPLRRVPILPRNTSLVYEVVGISRNTRTGLVRFATADSTPTVWRDGSRLTQGVDYTFTAGSKMLTILTSAFKPEAQYLISYAPTDTVGLLDIKSTFGSRLVTEPDRFKGTGGNGFVTLTRPPFVDFDKINDEDKFFKISGSAEFHYRNDAGQSVIDGETWGFASTTLTSDITDSTTSIDVSSTTGFAVTGTIQIGSEKITYDNSVSLSSNSFDNCVRGVSGTQAAAASSGSLVISNENTVYKPLRVLVDGVEARNQTDYIRGEHPALELKSGSTLSYSYIHSGKNIYFNGDIEESRTIEVYYRVLGDYLRVLATMEQTVSTNRTTTPSVSEIIVLTNEIGT